MEYILGLQPSTLGSKRSRKIKGYIINTEYISIMKTAYTPKSRVEFHFYVDVHGRIISSQQLVPTNPAATPVPESQVLRLPRGRLFGFY